MLLLEQRIFGNYCSETKACYALDRKMAILVLNLTDITLDSRLLAKVNPWSAMRWTVQKTTAMYAPTKVRYHAPRHATVCLPSTSVRPSNPRSLARDISSPGPDENTLAALNDTFHVSATGTS